MGLYSLPTAGRGPYSTLVPSESSEYPSIQSPYPLAPTVFVPLTTTSFSSRLVFAPAKPSQ
jgi:hypothetical protein